MSDDKKPMEFWIDSDSWHVFTREPNYLLSMFFHVIEHSAYDALADENKKLREALEKIASREHTLSARIARDALKKGEGR